MRRDNWLTAKLPFEAQAFSDEAEENDHVDESGMKSGYGIFNGIFTGDNFHPFEEKCPV
jgi:hypothetical protein